MRDSAQLFALRSKTEDRKSGTEITKIQEKENQERNKEFEESQKQETKDDSAQKKQDAALVEDVLDRIRDKANADKQSGAFDRAARRNVSGKGGRAGRAPTTEERLAGIGGKTADKEKLVGDVIKSAEAIKDGIDGGELQTLFDALARLAPALEKRDADYMRLGREMLNLARKLEAQQKNLRK